MNLIEEIEKTEKLKNNIKLAKQNINAKILSGGGTEANTLAEVPEKIDDMLSNYKKYAEGDFIINDSELESMSYKIPVKWNTEFTPKKVIIRLSGVRYMNQSQYQYPGYHYLVYPSSDNPVGIGSITNITNTGCIVNGYNYYINVGSSNRTIHYYLIE